MKYQALKRLKTKTKLLKMCDTLDEATAVILADDPTAIFCGLSYIGQFPQYQGKHTYNVQGSVQLANGQSVVCSLSKDELITIKN